MNDAEMKGSNYNLPRGLITTYPDFIDQTVNGNSHLENGDVSRCTIHLISPGRKKWRKKKHKGTPAAHAPPIAITPALATVGHLIIWRRPHGILWLYKSQRKDEKQGGAPSTGRRRRKRGGKTGEKPEESVTIVLAISSTGERDRQTQKGDWAKGTQPRNIQKAEETKK